jgi:hypothetical protein
MNDTPSTDAKAKSLTGNFAMWRAGATGMKALTPKQEAYVEDCLAHYEYLVMKKKGRK